MSDDENIMEVTPFGTVDYDSIADHTYIQSIQNAKERELHEKYWQQYQKQMERFKARKNLEKPIIQQGGSSNERIKRYYKQLKDQKRI